MALQNSSAVGRRAQHLQLISLRCCSSHMALDCQVCGASWGIPEREDIQSPGLWSCPAKQCPSETLGWELPSPIALIPQVLCAVLQQVGVHCPVPLGAVRGSDGRLTLFPRVL